MGIRNLNVEVLINNNNHGDNEFMTESEIESRIYPSVVTHTGDWKKMIEDVEKLRLKEISLFITTAGVNERKKIYAELAKTSVKRIPHVHARHDMKEEEFDYFVKKYKTRVFTIHFQFIRFFKKSKYRKKFFVENNFEPKEINDLKKLAPVGGVCMDLSHLEQFRCHTKHLYKISLAMVNRFKIGCNHISAVRDDGWSFHYARDKHEFDYLINIPKRYFSKYINIELANPIREQLEYKKYIAHLLAKAWN